MNTIPAFSLVREEGHDTITLNDFPEYPFRIENCEFDDQENDMMKMTIVYMNGLPDDEIKEKLNQQIERMVNSALDLAIENELKSS